MYAINTLTAFQRDLDLAAIRYKLWASMIDSIRLSYGLVDHLSTKRQLMEAVLEACWRLGYACVLLHS